MKRSMGLFLMLAGIVFGLAGCATAPKDEKHRQALVDESTATVSRFQAEDPSIQSFLQNAYGYAVFPSIGKGGLGVGGAYGRGTVYEQGKMVGYADMTQATIGLQLGGQTFSELIVFQDKAALDRFRNNQLAFQAGASAVAIRTGAAATAKYTDGVAVFTHATGGLMVEAAIGGQKFTFVPVANQSAMSGQPPAVQASAPQQPAPPPHYEGTGGAAAGGATVGGAAAGGAAAGATVTGSSSDRPSAAASVSTSPPPAAAPTTRPSGELQETPPKTVDIGTVSEPSPAPAPAPGAPATRPTTAPSSGG